MPRTEIVMSPPPARMPPFPPKYFNPGELDRLVALVASVRPRCVVEFGCNDGRAAATILLNLPGVEEYVGVDVLPGYVTLMACQRREVPDDPGRLARHDPRFRLVTRPRGSFDLAPSDLPEHDAAFIDADHSRLGVLNDRALALSRLRPGGIVIYHDDNGLIVVEVARTLDELADAGADIVHVAGTWLAYERIH